MDVFPQHPQTAHSDIPALMGDTTDRAVALKGANPSKDFRYKMKAEQREKGQSYMIYEFLDHPIPLSLVILGSVFAVRNEFDLIDEA